MNVQLEMDVDLAVDVSAEGRQQISSDVCSGLTRVIEETVFETGIPRVANLFRQPHLASFRP